MKIAVYDRYWSTAGGAEKFAGVVAQVLAEEHDVDLFSTEPVDRAMLGERLRLDLSKVGERVVPPLVGAITEASADYDLFVNASFLSGDFNGAKRGVYIVHFPGKTGVRFHRARKRIAPLIDRRHGPLVEWGTGWYPREGGVRGCTWSNGEGKLRIALPVGETTTLRLTFGSHRPLAAGPTDIVVEVDGATVSTTPLERHRSLARRALGTTVSVTLVGKGVAEPLDVRVRSAAFVPTALGSAADDRRLGVPMTSMTFGGPIRGRLRQAVEAATHDPLAFLPSYDLIVSNSVFTQGWVRRWWGVESSVLYPPVPGIAARPKDQVILGVGRFFGADRGHSKKQLEMVHAFRRLVADGVSGWELHLVGGCSAADEPYLREVEAAAAGLPVVLHANAPGADLVELYGRASIFWHATGLGEDPNRHPDRQEHFGISTVEAMSAGAVPIVIRAAGQVEIVRNGIDGWHFDTLDELVERTRLVIADPDGRARASAAAAARAEQFGVDAFRARLLELVGGVTS